MSSSGNPVTQYGKGTWGKAPIEFLDVAYYNGLITSEYRNAPKFLAFLNVFLQKFQDVSNCLTQITQAVDVDNASGVALDFLGAIVGANRQMRSPVVVGGVSYTQFPDYAFRILIKMYIAMNQWDGTIPGIYEVWNASLGPLGYELLVQDLQDMSMFYVFLNPPTDQIILAIIEQGYFDLVPAGVNLLGFYTPGGFPTFSYDIENANFQGFDQGYWLVPLGSGYGSSAYGESPYGESGYGD